jgi:hypothetical protein
MGASDLINTLQIHLARRVPSTYGSCYESTPEFLEAEVIGYTIRLPANRVFQDRTRTRRAIVVAKEAQGPIMASRPSGIWGMSD